jgi:hypothetical protein
MARKGRKDSGELYDVFRKITSEQPSKGVPESFPAYTGEPGEEEGEETPQTSEQRKLDIGRAFIVSYNTAVITFVAFIIILLWVYLVGVERGEKKIIQRKSEEETQNINKTEKEEISSIKLSNEMGTAENLWTVEVYKVPNGKLDILEKNIRKPLQRQKDVKETFIAKTEDRDGYVLWVNTFPKDSTDGLVCLENMLKMEARHGGKAFANAKLVPFDKSRVIK